MNDVRFGAFAIGGAPSARNAGLIETVTAPFRSPLLLAQSVMTLILLTAISRFSEPSKELAHGSR